MWLIATTNYSYRKDARAITKEESNIAIAILEK